MNICDGSSNFVIDGEYKLQFAQIPVTLISKIENDVLSGNDALCWMPVRD